MAFLRLPLGERAIQIPEGIDSGTLLLPTEPLLGTLASQPLALAPMLRLLGAYLLRLKSP